MRPLDGITVVTLEQARVGLSVGHRFEVWAHPQLQARRRWTEVATPGGPIPALRPPGLPDGCEPRMNPVPALGEHTEAILRELGHDDAAIGWLREAGVV